MKHIIPIMLLIFLPGLLVCCRQPTHNPDVLQQPEPQETDSIPLFHHISDVIADTLPTHWGNYTGHFTSALHFHDAKDTLVMEYFGDCYYYYPLRVSGDTITVYWSNVSECKGTAGFKKPTSAHRPVIGKPFMLLTLANDTTLRATYLYPEWVKAVDDKQGSELFPAYFVAHQP